MEFVALRDRGVRKVTIVKEPVHEDLLVLAGEGDALAFEDVVFVFIYLQPVLFLACLHVELLPVATPLAKLGWIGG